MYFLQFSFYCYVKSLYYRPIEMNIEDKREVVSVIDAIFLGHLDFLFCSSCSLPWDAYFVKVKRSINTLSQLLARNSNHHGLYLLVWTCKKKVFRSFLLGLFIKQEISVFLLFWKINQKSFQKISRVLCHLQCQHALPLF